MKVSDFNLKQEVTKTIHLNVQFLFLCFQTELSSNLIYHDKKYDVQKIKWQIIILSSFLFFFHFSQFIPRRRIGKRVSGKAWSAPLLWLSSSVSCLSQPIRCCGTAWSNQLHCEHGEWTEQPWPHILSLQPKLDHNPSTSLNNQLSFVLFF